VPIHEVGQHAGQHYFTMPFVAGGSLAQQRDRFRDRHAAAGLVEKVARAVGAAHAKGILHRDLKPANVLLDEHGEPLVADFGLARVPEPDEELTQSGQLVGTPAYMAPEQAAGRASAVSSKSDVWALGVLLYELLSGRRPFTGPGLPEVSRQIQTADPPRLRALRPGLDRALETIVLRCLEKDPARRYGSAEALADDLGRWRRGEPIVARPEGWPRRAWRAVRRHPTLATLAVLAVLAAAATAVALHYADPDRPLWAVQRKLAAGEPVTLVGETGSPDWRRWHVTEGAVIATRDGTFTLHTLSMSLLDLVGDPQGERYRFAAQVRLNESFGGRVGIYFARGKHAAAPGVVHHLADLTFSLRPAVRGFFHRRQTVADVSLKLRQQDESAKGPGANRTFSLLGKVFPLPGAEAGSEDWHALAVEVTPAQLRVFWDNRPVGTVSAAALKISSQAFEEDGAAPGRPRFELAPRGGLGLFVYRGSASFRRVVVEPLAGPK
jgi:serine/threonine-protein kinase